MEFKNSYIFLKRKNESIETSNKDNKLNVKILPSFEKTLQKSFPNISFLKENNSLNSAKKGSFKINYKDSETEIFFKYYDVRFNCYLDIVVKGQRKQDAIKILTIVSDKLVGKGNIFDKDYVSIVSYDYASEYYCNKLFPYLNEFERKLRKILFIIYTLNFDLKYYSSTTSEEFQSNLKKKS